MRTDPIAVVAGVIVGLVLGLVIVAALVTLAHAHPVAATGAVIFAAGLIAWARSAAEEDPR